jgi:hypothetical protein
MHKEGDGAGVGNAISIEVMILRRLKEIFEGF